MYLDCRIKKSFPELELNASISAKKGELVCLLGKVGAGKTTILQIISGLLESEGSQVWVDGKNVSQVPAEKRNFGFAFQEKLLFPHMNVLENAEFGVRMHGMKKEKAIEALEAVGIERLANREIGTLSGGEAQRAAIARAIAYQPRLLLLDEPFKEIDGVAKEKIKIELKRLQKDLKITTILVTHDVEEAFYLSDKVYLLSNGKVLQEGTIKELMRKPANEAVKGYFSPYMLIKHAGKDLIARKTSIR
ncbi:ATP-binding cassette domain-containing protein [Candidatus Micrarchaeota archaeon]|nr:ATP-binding cassette domain-containing protein [Candidatus Micrarchaeota archaeon]